MEIVEFASKREDHLFRSGSRRSRWRGCGGELLEKEIALDVSMKIRDYLQEQGALVLMTREDDSDLSSKNTRGYARKKAEDLITA